jgi:hypothetical protein
VSMPASGSPPATLKKCLLRKGIQAQPQASHSRAATLPSTALLPALLPAAMPRRPPAWCRSSLPAPPRWRLPSRQRPPPWPRPAPGRRQGPRAGSRRTWPPSSCCRHRAPAVDAGTGAGHGHNAGDGDGSRSARGGGGQGAARRDPTPRACRRCLGPIRELATRRFSWPLMRRGVPLPPRHGSLRGHPGALPGSSYLCDAYGWVVAASPAAGRQARGRAGWSCPPV